MNLINFDSSNEYEKKVEKYKYELLKNPNDSGWLGAHGKALLCLGRLNEALHEYQKAHEYQNNKDTTDKYLNRVGVILWMLGRQNEAVKVFKESIDGIENGSILYSDLVGGISQGLLLWYAGVSSSNVEAEEHSIKYLKKLSKKSRINSLPGPFALYVIEEKSEVELLQEACETNILNKAIELAKTDLYKRRQLVRTLFYFAIKKRKMNLEIECMDLMEKCMKLENPIIENEWYLAYYEINKTKFL